MKTTIAYEIFYFLEGKYFWRPLNFECLISEIYTNITFKHFTKCRFTLWFYSFFKNGQKKIRRWYLSVEKNRKKAKQCYHNDICRWKRDSFSSEVEITRGIVWIKISKKQNFKKDLMDLIEKNNQINMTSDHSVSSNNSFKIHLNAKRFNMAVVRSTVILLQCLLQRWCERIRVMWI